MAQSLHLDTSLSRQQLNNATDIYSFRNSLPPNDFQTSNESRIPQLDTGQSEVELQPRSFSKTLFWPVLVITIPIALISASLLALVFAYQVKSEQSLFNPSQDGSPTSNGLYILVNYSATRIVFAASFLSTLAPILVSFVMTLWALPVAQSMRDASLSNEMHDLPTPYQLSLIVGLTLSSLERLRAYYAYAFSRSRKAGLPPVLNRAAMMMTISILMAVAVFVTDTALHYTVSTIEFDKLSSPSGPMAQYGRGLTSSCADFNRTANSGLPCSFDFNQMSSDPNGFIRQGNEIFRLSQNVSTLSEVRIVDAEDAHASHHAVLLPRNSNTGVDFKASTLSVSTTCKLITEQCNPKWYNGNTTGGLDQFKCSDAFYGIIGADPVTSQFDSQVDLNISVLSFKPSSNLQFGYFTDSELQHIYNPIGYSAARGTSSYFTGQPLANDELINPVHLGVAGRFAQSGELTYGQLDKLQGFFANTYNGFTDFVLSCEITTYDTEYVWIDGQFAGISSTTPQNGSVWDIFQGRQFYSGISTSAFDLQTYLTEAAMARTTSEFEQTWADLYSTKVLSTIGAYTTSHTNLQEQVRTPLLVARVPKPALGALIGCSLAYTVMGILLGFTAARAASGEIRQLVTHLSLPALTNAAFDEKSPGALHSSIDLQSGLTSDNSSSHSEMKRVVVDFNREKGYGSRQSV